MEGNLGSSNIEGVPEAGWGGLGTSDVNMEMRALNLETMGVGRRGR
jgi:hypothetical protein